jgi:glycosyltransferase involved in cell wall biosynthesis
LDESPGVTAVIATRDRPELLAAAIDSILGQTYDGPVEVIVVFDQAPVRTEIERPISDEPGSGHPGRVGRAVANTRSVGLAGARNTGIGLATGDLIAFCDDDDRWAPGKLTTQVARLTADRAVMAVGGIRIHFGEVVRERCPATATVTAGDLARSRMTGAHPSTFLIRTDALLGRLGLVDEDIPYGYGEDYDLLLRAARLGPVSVVGEVLAEVLWHPGSYFSRRWEAMIDGLGYLLVKHPEIAADRAGAGWIQGQRAFALAAAGRRREALATAWRSFRLSPRELRAPLAVLVATRLVSAERVMRELNRRGRGI